MWNIIGLVSGAGIFTSCNESILKMTRPATVFVKAI